MTSKVGVIDYGMGNIGSICKMLRLVGAEPIVSSNLDGLASAGKLVLPGVGHFDRAMTNLRLGGLADELKWHVLSGGKQVLGICLGMQLLCRSSEEGSEPGLGLLDARVRRFSFTDNPRLKVPHMGWRELDLPRPSAMLDGLDHPSRFYFVHSYFVECADDSDIVARAHYGHPFVAAFARGPVWGVQFHPEKSHRFGVRVFENFVRDRS